MNRCLQTTGKGYFEEVEYEVPPLSPDEICVRAVMTGVCRSDIDMMQGNFGPLPLNMQGHEGLGQVVDIGADITGVKFGDYVATRGEPAYADIYNVRRNEFVVVPEANPKYILEPVACGINVVMQDLRGIVERSGSGRRLLIIGSGFLAWIAYNTIILNHIDIDITVRGSSNTDLWKSGGVQLTNNPEGNFDVVIDLGGDDSVFTKDFIRNEALIIFGVQKTITTDFGNLLWKACTVSFPSPRTDGFHNCMQKAANWIEDGKLNVDNFWTKCYNRDTEWPLAFSDALVRPTGYSRGYIYWNEGNE